jgi:cell division transport system permease protein
LRLGYAIAEAFRSMRRVPLMSTVAVGTISLSLMVFGLFLLITWNVRSELEKVRAMVDVEAYLESGVGETEALRLQARAASISGVADVAYVSSEQARDRFVADFGDSTLLELLGENPLPASLLVTVTADQQTASGVETVARRIEDLDGVDEVVFGQRFLERFDRLVLVLSAISILIGLVVSLASVFVIGNTVKLTVWARRGAIEIMKLVGASDGFVKLPFLIEGTLQGIAGAAIALGILYGLFAYVSPEIGGMSFLPTIVSGAVLLMGALLGGIGSQVSLKQFLEV